MQSKRERLGLEMTLLPPLETLVPEDHHLRRLDRVLDLRFVHEAVRDRYCQDNGRPSVDPEVIFRLFLLQALEGIPHVRDLMRQVQVNLAYRWFIGYRMDEKLPDHSTLSRALDRLGDEVFDELFKRSIRQCQASGLIEGKVLHVDATTIRADIDANRVNHPNSSDKDARFGRFPGNKTRPGYKQHTIADGKKRVVVGVSVSPANTPEGKTLEALVDSASGELDTTPEAVCADSAYGSGRNRVAMDDRGIRLVSPPPKAKTYTGDSYFTTEDFRYDKDHDWFVCPADRYLQFLRIEKARGRREYRAHRSDCRMCPFKSQCTKSNRRTLKVSVHHQGLVELRADSKTDSFRRLYSSRAPVIEGIFGESKQWHSLGRAWRRGLCKMKVQCLLVAAVLNFKRLMSLVGGSLTLWWLLGSLFRLLRRHRAITGVNSMTYPIINDIVSASS
ncbi:MAG: transposase [Anaerolineaceae bacterium]|nr:transposase [Anaerolineaceae bacterium]